MHEAARPFIKRARLRAALRGALRGGLIGAAALLTALAVGRWTPYPSVAVGAGLFVVSVLASAFFSFKKARPALILAEIDRFYGLKDRVQTACAVETRDASTAMEEALIADAALRLSNADIKAWMPRLLPRWGWASPCALALACAPLLLPAPPPDPDAMSVDEQTAARGAVNALAHDPDAAQKLKQARTMREAFAALAEAERRTEEAAQSGEALETAQSALKRLNRRDGEPLSEALLAAASDPPPELTAQLRALRDALASNRSAEALTQALAEIETAAVSAAKLNAIAEQLRQLERQADPNASEILKRIREQKRKLAAAALNARPQNGAPAGGNNAGADPDNDPSAQAPGALLEEPLQPSAQLHLKTLENAGARQEAVYLSNKETSGGDAPVQLLPFKQAALQASRAALADGGAGAVNAERLPAAYRERIQRYFKAVEAAAQTLP